MKCLKYTIPIGFCLLLMGLVHWQMTVGFFAVLLFAKLSNPILGEYTEPELRAELKFYYGSKYAYFFKIGCAFFLTIFNVWALLFVFQHPDNFGQLFLFLAAIVFVNASYSLPMAHDLEHGKSKLSLLAGNCLLVWICLPFFREDHIQGHHKLVGTENDRTSARIDQSFYQFFGKSLKQRIYRCYFQEEFMDLHHRREIQLFSIFLLAMAAVLFWIKPVLCFFWLMQAGLVYILHELINYIQHYGLQRENGAPIEIHHSWNCFYKYTNYTLFLLPVHSAHHVGKPLHEIKTIMGPKLPLPFFESAMLALVPKLWFSLMNPLVEEIRKQEIHTRKASGQNKHNNEITIF